MPAPIPLPGRISSAPFTVETGRELGLGRRRMQRPDLARPFWGVRQQLSPASIDALGRAYLTRMAGDSVFCSITAALLMGVPLPQRLESSRVLHVAVPPTSRAPRAHGVVGHTLALAPGEREMRRGLPMTSAARTWCDLATELNLDDLIAAGDYLIHVRRPLATIDELAGKLQELSGRRGVAALREALPQLDPRAESRKETLLRLVLLRGGIQGLVSNHWIVLPRLGARYRADLAIPEFKVAIEYQSDYHRHPAQWRQDMTRISRLEAEGWVVIQVNSDDLSDPAELVTRVLLVISTRLRVRQAH